jgi:hypothetical protein
MPARTAGFRPRHPLSPEIPMKKLRLDALTVESFAISDGSADEGFTIAQPPGVSDGLECNQTLYVSCDTCKCLTPRYNCV